MLAVNGKVGGYCVHLTVCNLQTVKSTERVSRLHRFRKHVRLIWSQSSKELSEEHTTLSPPWARLRQHHQHPGGQVHYCPQPDWSPSPPTDAWLPTSSSSSSPRTKSKLGYKMFLSLNIVDNITGNSGSKEDKAKSSLTSTATPEKEHQVNLKQP